VPDVRAYARALGARIVERRGGVGRSRCVISEYHTRGKTIVLYRDSLALLARLVAACNLPFDPAQLEDVAIVHECFHLIAPHANEDAAHEFVRVVLGLAASPAVLSQALSKYLQP
jgi:hypothetical protein